MQLLIVRHGIAVPRGTPGIADADRPLTPEGRSRFRECAQGIARLVDPADALLTSPWRRARQTAEILAEAWARPEPVETQALAGGSFEDLAAVLANYDEEATVALVGHEPHLSALVARLLGCRHEDRLA